MATTIIDFSPQALEIDQVAQAAGSIKPGIPPPSLPTMNSGVVINGTSQAGDQFAAGAPDILFTAEYATQGSDSSGVLIAWENYYNATHYEVFKRVYTAQDNSWQRILIIDSIHLKTETNSFKPYIANVLKFDIGFDYYAIVDTDVKQDQIVEYKIAAGCYPTSATIDYHLSLKSQGFLNKLPINSTDTIFDFSSRVFTIPDYAWVVALLNGGQYFGKKAVQVPLATQLGLSYAYVPRDLSVIPKMLQESIYFFGLTATMKNCFNIMRDTLDGDAAFQFFTYALAAIINNNALSYTTLQASLRSAYPDYNDYVARAQNGSITSTINITPWADSTSFVSMNDFTTVFARLNSMLVGVLYANDVDFMIQINAELSNVFKNIFGATTTPAPKAQPRDLLPPTTPKITLPTVTKSPTIANPFGTGPFGTNKGFL